MSAYLRSHTLPRPAQLLAGIALLMGLALAGCQPTPEAAAQAPATEAAPEVLQVQGKLEPRRSATLSLPQGGRAAQVNVAEGQLVEAGEVLVVLDGYEGLQAEMAVAEEQHILARQALDELYKQAATDRTLAEVELSLAEKEQAIAEDHAASMSKPLPQKDIDQAYANMLLAEDQLEKAQEDLAKAQRIYTNKKHIIWQFINKHQFKLRITLLEQKAATYERRYQDAVEKYKDRVNFPDPIDKALAQARLEGANARLSEAQQNLAELSSGPDPDDVQAAQAHLEAAHARLEAAQVALRSAELVAPISGVVVDLEAQPGKWIPAGGTWAVLADLSEWQVVSDEVPEKLAPQIYVGQLVRLGMDALPELEFEGQVESLSLFYTEEDGDIHYTVKIKAFDYDPRQRWGMTVDIEFLPETTTN